MPLTRTKKSKDRVKNDEASPSDEVKEDAKAGGSPANDEQSQSEVVTKKSYGQKEAVSNTEEKETKGEKDPSQVVFSTDGSEPQEDKGPSPEKDESTSVKSPSPETGQGGQRRHGQKKQRQQHWQNKKRGGGKHQHFKQKQKPKRRRRKTPSDLEERYPLEIGNLHECEQLANVEAIDASAEECPVGDGDALDFNSLYVLDLVELKEKISELEPDLELPLAPVREEMFDLLFN